MVVWHYSAFSYGVRGVPLLAPIVAVRIRLTRVPVIVVLHEFAYPWGRKGWRGFVLSAAQRLALVIVLWAVRGAVITTDHRRRWIQTRWWLPRRPLRVAPVFSTVTGATQAEGGGEYPHIVGVLGYGAESIDEELAVHAMAKVIGKRPEATLLLVGGPGPESIAGQRWRSAMDSVGCAGALQFTGVLPEEELSHEIRRVPVFLSPHTTGPTPRKTTLAALLEHGRCVVAVDGPERWDAPVIAEALILAKADPDQVAQEVCSLLDDEGHRRALSERAVAFARGSLDPSVVASELGDFFQQVVAMGSRTPWR